jgi:hypothetical protein
MCSAHVGGLLLGIDMALHLASRLADQTTAQAIQLYTEYDPQPLPSAEQT